MGVTCSNMGVVEENQREPVNVMGYNEPLLDKVNMIATPNCGERALARKKTTGIGGGVLRKL